MDETAGPAPECGILLLEGWMLGTLMFPAALAEVLRVPAANDPGNAPVGAGSG